jgi:hypothetical protein
VDQAIDLDVVQASWSQARDQRHQLRLCACDLASVLSDELHDDCVGGLDSSREGRVDLGRGVSLGDLSELGRLDEVSDEALAVDERVGRRGGRSVDGGEVEGLDGDGVGFVDNLREGKEGRKGKEKISAK